MNILSQKYSRYLEVLGNEERIKILELLMEKKMCVKEINTHFFAAQATISYHLTMLKNIDFVTTEKEGKYIYYSLNSVVIKDYLKNFVTDFNMCLKQ